MTLSLIACESGSNRSSRSPNGQVARTGAEATAVDFTGLFKDTWDARAEDLSSKRPDCLNQIKISTSRNVVVPWPQQEKNHIMTFFSSFPRSEMLKESIFGMYLIEDDALAINLTCTRKDRKSYIFFVKSSMTVNGSFQAGFATTDHTLFMQAFDYPHAVALHEAMHAIDAYYFFDYETGILTPERQKVAELSWTPGNLDQSRFRKISVTFLTGGTSAQQEAADLDYMANQTNFSCAYCMQNFQEDFAESFTNYYMGTRTKLWPSWRVFEKLPEDPKTDQGIIATISVKSLLTKNEKQRQKLCAVAKLVLQEDCETLLNQALK